MTTKVDAKKLEGPSDTNAASGAEERFGLLPDQTTAEHAAIRDADISFKRHSEELRRALVGS